MLVFTGRREDGDASVEDGGSTDITVRLHRETVERLLAGKGADDSAAPLSRRVERPRSDKVERPEASRIGFGAVGDLLIRRR